MSTTAIGLQRLAVVEAVGMAVAGMAGDGMEAVGTVVAGTAADGMGGVGTAAETRVATGDPEAGRGEPSDMTTASRVEIPLPAHMAAVRSILTLRRMQTQTLPSI